MENGRETRTATRDVRFDFTYTPEKNGGQRTISLDGSSEHEARLKFHELTGCSMYDSFKVHCPDGEVERLYYLMREIARRLNVKLHDGLEMVLPGSRRPYLDFTTEYGKGSIDYSRSEDPAHCIMITWKPLWAEEKWTDEVLFGPDRWTKAGLDDLVSDALVKVWCFDEDYKAITGRRLHIVPILEDIAKTFRLPQKEIFRWSNAGRDLICPSGIHETVEIMIPGHCRDKRYARGTNGDYYKCMKSDTAVFRVTAGGKKVLEVSFAKGKPTGGSFRGNSNYMAWFMRELGIRSKHAGYDLGYDLYMGE